MASARVEILPRLMGEADAARYLGVSPSKLRELGLPRRVLDRRRLYERADLDAYADSLAYEGEAAREDTCARVFGD